MGVVWGLTQPDGATEAASSSGRARLTNLSLTSLTNRPTSKLIRSRTHSLTLVIECASRTHARTHTRTHALTHSLTLVIECAQRVERLQGA